MKRLELLRYLESQGCRMVREGGNHTVYVNPVERKASVVPRHKELDEFLCQKICKDLGVSPLGRL